jgi:hypothetical protein
MSTQKKETPSAKNQPDKANAQRTPIDATAQKGRGADEQRKPEQRGNASAKPKAGDRKPTNERENDSKRPHTNIKKH